MSCGDTRLIFFFVFFSFFFFFLFKQTHKLSRSILPLPRSFLHHSHRADLLFRTTPLPPRHCHSSSHRHPPISATQPLPLIFLVFFLVLQTPVSRPILPLPRSNSHHSHRTAPTNRMTPLPPRHCHSSSHCQPPIPATQPLPLIFLIFYLFFKPSQLCQYCHCHALTGTILTALLQRID
jgi:hypothetical protein